MALQFTPQPPQCALVRRSRHTPLQQRIHVFDPHEVPSGRERVQLRLSVKLRGVHAPASQRCSVRVRVCVPVSSQASAKPPQLLHAP